MLRDRHYHNPLVRRCFVFEYLPLVPTLASRSRSYELDRPLGIRLVCGPCCRYRRLGIPSLGKAIGKPLEAALGEVREKGDEMLVAYSVLNTTNHWIEVLPPQVELNSPNLDGEKKKNKKKREILAEKVPITDYRLNARRLAPGERADGAVQFARPGFKQSKDRLLLQLATASAVDTPLLMPVPFVAPGR